MTGYSWLWLSILGRMEYADRWLSRQYLSERWIAQQYARSLR